MPRKSYKNVEMEVYLRLSKESMPLAIRACEMDTLKGGIPVVAKMSHVFSGMRQKLRC